MSLYYQATDNTYSPTREPIYIYIYPINFLSLMKDDSREKEVIFYYIMKYRRKKQDTKKEKKMRTAAAHHQKCVDNKAHRICI